MIQSSVWLLVLRVVAGQNHVTLVDSFSFLYYYFSVRFSALVKKQNRMAYQSSIIIAVVIFVISCCRAAVIPPEWANIRINPCAKVVTHISRPSSA